MIFPAARGVEVAELDVEGSDPIRHNAVGNLPDHVLLDVERHLASSRVRRAVGAEDGMEEIERKKRWRRKERL